MTNCISDEALLIFTHVLVNSMIMCHFDCNRKPFIIKGEGKKKGVSLKHQ